MTVREEAHACANQVIAIRRDLHQHPELGMHENRTTLKIEEFLKKLEIPYKKLYPTGIIAEIDGASPGKTVALRADMDALPIEEKTDVPFKSVEKGCMHACGHDAHTAMLLGAALILNSRRSEFCGKVRLIYQPGEEIGKGAKAVIEQGGIENVSMIFGLHIICPLPVGTVMCSKGVSHAASDTFRITIHGKSSHAAAPHHGHDALLCAAQLATTLQTIVSREIDPLEPAVVTIGTLHAGTAENIIAKEATLTGTVRTTSREVHEKIPVLLNRMAQAVAEANGCTAELDYKVMTEIVENDGRATDIGIAAANKIMDGTIICKGLRTMGGEDFGAYTAYAPASFFSVGAGGVGPMHGDCFQPDESAFEIGTALYVQMALDALEQLNKQE